MTAPRFDPGGFYQFNLTEGAVQTRDGARVVMLTDAVVAPLVAAAVGNGDLTAVRRMGQQIGDQVRSDLGEALASSAPEAVLTQCSGVLALFGWGKLSAERWGDALVAVMQHAPALDDERLGIAALLGGMLSSLMEREVACVPAGDDRFVIVDPAIAETVWAWSREGASVASIIERLAAPEGA